MEEERIKAFIKIFLTIIFILLIFQILKNKNQQSKIVLEPISMQSEIIAINEKLVESGYTQKISENNCEYDDSQKTYYYQIEDNLDIYIQVEDVVELSDLERNVKSVGVSYREEIIIQEKVEDIYRLILKANSPKISELTIENILEGINDDENKIDLGNKQYKTKEIEDAGLRCNKLSNPVGYSFYMIERLTKYN